MSVLRSRPVRFGGLVTRPRRAGYARGEVLTPGMRVGLFGGSFDPPHPGHAHLARTAMRRLKLDRVWWVVSPQNPLKDRKAGELAARMKAVAEFATAPGMVVTDVEDRLGIRRSADLIDALVERHPAVNFVWLMGADNLGSFHRWGRWQDIAKSVPIAVMARPTDPIRARLSPFAQMHNRSRIREFESGILPLKTPPAWTYLTEPLDCHSSTALRARN